MIDEAAQSYGLVVRFEVLAGHEDAFDVLTAQTVARIRSEEPGTLVYLTHREPGSSSVRVFYELYRDVAAFEEHETSEHVQRFLRERAAHLRSEPLVWRVAPQAGVVRDGAGFAGG
ncbi:MAG TPA: putative quinol monooxygenase [Acidimicrobiia bacterium]|nr:putative quinol monooxygenase [Acidimicrobiia bacterium]